MAWYSHLFKNFPQFLVIHTVKGFGIVNKAEIDVFLELSCFFDDLIFRNRELAARAAVRKTSLPLATVTLIPHLTGSSEERSIGKEAGPMASSFLPATNSFFYLFWKYSLVYDLLALNNFSEGKL